MTRSTTPPPDDNFPDDNFPDAAARRTASGPRVRPIAVKLIVWFVVIAILPMTLVALLAESYAEHSLYTEIQNHLRTTADSKARQVHAFFRERIEDVTTLGKTPGVVEAMERFADATGPRFDLTRFATTDADIRPFLSLYVESVGYEKLYLFNTDGVMLMTVSSAASAAPASPDSQRAIDSELAKAVNLAGTLLEPSLSDIVRDPQTGQWATFLAAPVMRNTEVVGVVALQISPREINAVVQDYTGLGTTGEIMAGVRLGNDVVFVTPLRHDHPENFQRKIAMGGPLALPMQQAVQGQRGRGQSIDYRDQSVIAVWQYVPSFRWGMVAKIDRDEAFAPVRRLRWQALLIGLLAALLVVGLAIIVARTISRPVVQLTQSVKHIAAGNFDHRAAIDSSDEIGTLAAEFNQMGDRLNENIQRLSAQEIRTQAILDSTADGIVTVADDGTVCSINAAAKHLFAVTDDRIVGHPVEDLSPHLKQLLNDPTRYGDEWEIPSADPAQSSTGIPLAVRLTEMNHNDERLMIAMLQDIRQRKRAEAARADLDAGIRNATGCLNLASQKILTSTAQQTESAQEQAAIVSQTTSTVEQVTRAAQQESERAQTVAASARRADEVSQAGREAIQSAIAAMRKVQGQSESTAESIVSLAERAQAIGEIVATVKQIAEQTNLLALNAAIEASRSGEHGKGFAVVATEVKSLAQRSKDATQKIRRLLTAILDATNDAVLHSEQGSQAIVDATAVIAGADDTIHRLSKTISEAAHAATAIMASAQHQAIALNQISQSMTHADEATQQTLTAVRQSDLLAKDLNELGIHLLQLIQRGESSDQP